MILLNDYLKKEYGCKVYKLSLQMDVTCPVRDGSIDTRGCIFCSGGGSGEFASCRTDPIADQLAEAKKKVAAKATTKTAAKATAKVSAKAKKDDAAEEKKTGAVSCAARINRNAGADLPAPRRRDTGKGLVHAQQKGSEARPATS